MGSKLGLQIFFRMYKKHGRTKRMQLMDAINNHKR
jgi:hypothetical protein